MTSVPLARAVAAEAIGTFALVFAGAGAIMVNAKTDALGHVGVALTFGLVIMAMIYAVGHISAVVGRDEDSGAHFNPAVSFAFALTRHFPWGRAVAYWIAQVGGATAAALILRGSLGDLANVGATLPSGSDGQAFLWETILTFFLMFVIMAVATDTRAVGEAAAIDGIPSEKQSGKPDSSTCPRRAPVVRSSEDLSPRAVPKTCPRQRRDDRSSA